MNTNIAALYEFVLQQMAAESYFEGINLADADAVKAQLRLGTNRAGYREESPELNEGYPGYTRMTAQQADEFLTKYTLVHQWSDNPSTGNPPGSRPQPEGDQSKPQLNKDILANTGLSATLMRKLDTNGSPTDEYTLALRSTEFRPWASGGDAQRDKTGADISSIAFKGFALAQLDALERYYAWVKENTDSQGVALLPSGAVLNVTGYSLGGHLATVFTEIHLSEMGGGQTVTFNGAGRGTWNRAAGGISDMISYYRSVLNDPEIVPNPGGVSGGLREAARGKKGSIFDEKSIYEDPRYLWAVQSASERFGLLWQGLASEFRTGTTADGHITQVFGYETLNNTNFTANSGTHGPALRVGIESQPLLEGIGGVFNTVGDFGSGHSITLLSDSLGLQRVLHQLDPSYDLKKFIDVLPASTDRGVTNGVNATYEADALENVLDAVRFAILGSNAGRTEFKEGASGFGDITKREGFYANLFGLANSARFKSLEGRVLIRTAGADLRAAARNDFGAVVALLDLAPVWVTGKDSVGDAVLSAIWQGTRAQDFAAWQADKTDPTPIIFSDSWLADRSAMLAGLVQRNRRNVDVVVDLNNTDYEDLASSTVITQRINGVGANAPANEIVFGTGADDVLAGSDNFLGDRFYGGAGDDFIDGKGGNDYIEGNAGVDDLYGGNGNDTILGGAGDDTLSGEEGNDILSGGKGDDSYRFDDAFGKDTVTDSDGNGSILIDATQLGKFKGAGKRGGYAFDMGGGQYAGLAVIDSASSTTGYKAVILKGSDTSNTITINSFDPKKALDGGYLGIKLDSTPDIALVRGGGPNYWRDIDAKSDALEGKSSTFANGGGANFFISLSEGARAGAKLILHLAGLAGKGLAAIRGNDIVDADGAVITLAEGQTEVSFALVQEGDLGGDASGALSVSYQADGISASSNSWGLTLKDAGEIDNTIAGDSVASTRTIGDIPISRLGLDGSQIDVVNPRTLYFVRDGQNNLVPGTTDPTLVPIYNDAHEVVGYNEIPSDDIEVTDNTLYGTSGNDRIDGKTGNDLLAGSAGDDQIDGGTGNDMIGGGAGNDHILGGDGDDFISSSADIQPDRQQLGPDDRWAAWGKPANAVTVAVGTMWGVYPDANDATASVWNGMSETRTDAQSDSIDAGNGDDWVMASWGDDRIQGGAGDDHLEGLAGDDILEGGDGDDKLDGDGILKVGYQDSVGADRHGSDFIDGGAGNDAIRGGGGGDNIFGGAGNDTIFADGSGASDSQTFVELRYQGEDYIDGEDGDDYAEGGGKDDTLYGGAGNDTLWGDTSGSNLKDASATDALAWGNDYLDGEDGDDLLYGGGGDDMLYGGKGNDQLLGDDGPALAGSMHGSDYLDGEEGDDTLVGGGKDDTLFGGAGDDTLQGDADDLDAALHGDDYLDGEAGDDVLIGQGGSDQLFGGAGDDQLQGDGVSVADEFHGADLLDGGDGDDRLFGGGGDDTLIGGAGADQMSGDDGNDLLNGGDGADVLVGGSGNDILQGGEADDSIYGGTGDDQIAGGAGNDDLNSGDGDDLIHGGAGDDRYGILKTNGSKIIVDESGTETLDLGWKLADTELGRGSLLLRNTATGQEVHIEGFDADDATAVSPIERFVFSADDGTDFVLSAEQMIQRLGFAGHGTNGNDLLIGTAFNDVLSGGAGDDVLVGNAGDDRLDGGLGANQLLGGLGDDLYLVSVQGENKIIEFEGEGQDRVEASVDYILAAGNVETVMLTGSQAINATGSSGDDHLVGNGAANALDGAAGADLLEGKGGDDTYRVDNAADEVREQAGQGNDTVIASISYVLPLHVENLVLTGESVSATGNAANNHLQGNELDNRLRGADGNDRMEGGGGNDVYRVRADQGVKTIADSGGENDILDLGWNTYATHFVLGSTPNNLGLYNASTRQLVEIEGFDPLSENPVSSIEKMILFVPIFGGFEKEFWIDQVFREQGLSFFGTYADDALTGTWRRDSLFGFQGNDTLFGLGGDDSLDGGTGQDWMAGGAGDDEYAVDDPRDKVVEVAGEGFDKVLAESDFSIQGTDVEWLQMTDADHHTGIGNDLRNYLFASRSGSSLFAEGGNDEVFGGRGDDILHGGAGNDHMLGREGNDVLAGDDGDDELRADEGDDVLAGGAGNDRMYGDKGADRLDGGSGDDVLWGADGEDLLEGGEGADILRGEDGHDLLSGGGGDDTLLNSQGADILAGGDGDDTYREDTINGLAFGFAASGTEIVEGVDGGTDTVMVYESFTLGDNVENLTLLHRRDGALLEGIGNALDNRLENRGVGSADLFGLGGDDVLVGGAGVNRLDGGTGADLMIGGTGPTDYFVDNADDRVVASANGGNDTVHTSLDHTLGDFFENLILEEGSATIGTGNALFNKITGNSNDNVLDGGAGSDLIHGGGGNDVLIGTEGHDSLLGDDGDDLLLGSDIGTLMYGGSGHDRLFGGTGSDDLNGGAGADLMVGGAGDDAYVVDDLDDIVVEEADGGTELVTSFVDYALSDALENLTVAGYGLTGIGNAQDNVITGKVGGERLFGLDGDDLLDAGAGTGALLDGGAGRDTLVSTRGSARLVGGEGEDLYKLSAGDVELVELPGGGYDRVVLKTVPFQFVSLYLSENVEELDASAAAGDLFVHAASDDNLIISGSGTDVIDGGGGNDRIFGGQSRSAEIAEPPGVGIASALEDFFRRGVALPRTFERLLADFPYDISQDSAALYQPSAYTAWRVPASPDGTLERVPLYVSYWYAAPDISPELFIQPDGSLALEGDGPLQYLLSNWDPHSGPPDWDELQAQYGLRASVPDSERGAYLAVSGNRIPSPEKLEGQPWRENSYATVYWPRDRLPSDMQAILTEQLNSDEGGNALAYALAHTGTDHLSGGDGNDVLDGGDGNDLLFGGAGEDVLIGGADNEAVNVSVIGGSEAGYVSVVIASGASTNDDILDGGAGLDTLIGGSGNDTYYVDGDSTPNSDGRTAAFDWCDVEHRFGMDAVALDAWVTDVVTETPDQGNDRVIAGASVVLANIETVVLSESAPNLDIDATTDAGAQTLIGNSGRNTLNGNEGADLMAGGAGDDTYIVDDAADVVAEEADAGQDIVRTTVDNYVLGDNVEALLLDGDANLSASGNAVSNILIGNRGDNVLFGGAGDDFLAGWRGDDLLHGGEGFDYYVLARGDGHDTVDDADGELHFSGDIRFRELSFSADAYDLLISVGATEATEGVQVTLSDWLHGQAGSRVGQISFCTDAMVESIDEFVLMKPRNDLFTIAEGAAGVSGDLLDNDAAAVLRDRLTMNYPYSWIGQYGSALADENGSFEYTLNADSADFHALAKGQIGSDALGAYSAFDLTSGRWLGSAEVQVVVVGVNDAPAAITDFEWVNEDLKLDVTGNVLLNDTDVDQDTLSVSTVGTQIGAYGFLEITESGDFRYVLNNDSETVQSLGWDQWVTESFQYAAVDSHGAESIGTLEIEVSGDNDAPVGTEDLVACFEDGPAVAGNVLENDSDIDVNDVLAVSSTGAFAGLYGTLQLAEDGGFTYSVDNANTAVQALGAGQRASESFAYMLSDSYGESAQSKLTVEVVGVNDGPVAVADAVAAVEDGPTVAGNVLANDSDPDAGDTLAVGNPGAIAGQYGRLTLASDGAFVYAVDNSRAAVQALGVGQHASETFSYAVSDKVGATATSQLTVDITGVNDGPVAHADTAVVSEDGILAASGNVLVNDSDVDAGDVLAVSNDGSKTGLYGTLVIDSNGAYTYSLANGSTAVQALAAGQKVTDVFAYTVADTHGASATSQLSVEITGAADSAGVTLIGTPRNDRLVGTVYADIIDGGKGSDTLVGGNGDDLYLVDQSAQCNTEQDDDKDSDDDDHHEGSHRNEVGHHDDESEDEGCASALGDTVVELVNGGVDMVASSVNYVLPQNVENLMLLGSTALSGSGNGLANVIVASGGASSLSGAAGNDVLVGRSAADTIHGGTGDDRLYGEGGNDKLFGEQGADRIWGGSGNDVLDGGEGDNLIAGGVGDDSITSGSGSDVVVAGAGNDKVATGGGSDFVDAGAGDDTIDGGSGSDFIAAGKGSDVVTSGTGRDVIAFRRGDGQDTLLASSGSGSSDVLSLGGGIRYADLTLNRRGADLILGVGAADQITSKNWYSSQEKSISALQVVTVGGDYNAASTNRLLASKVVAFDFTTITQQYDAARKANNSLGVWALQPVLNSAFIGASNSSAFGGDLAFDHATTYGATQSYGTDMTVSAVRQEVKAQSGSTWQAIVTTPAAAPGPTLVDPWVALQAGTDLVVSKAPGASNPITPTNSPITDSLVLAALGASADIQQPTWAVR